MDEKTHCEDFAEFPSDDVGETIQLSDITDLVCQVKLQRCRTRQVPE